MNSQTETIMIDPMTIPQGPSIHGKQGDEPGESPEEPQFEIPTSIRRIRKICGSIHSSTAIEISLCMKIFLNASLLAASYRGAFRCLILLMASTAALQAQKPAASGAFLPERVESFIVKTRSEMNREIPFYLRVPKNYRPGKPYRLLLLCPHLNQ